MGQETEIAWTDATFNPWWGCQRVSPGCEHCYAETFAKRTGHNIWGPKAPHRFFGESHWREPLKWNRLAWEAGKRKLVFCASMADVFEDRDDLIEHRAKVFALIEATPNLDWLLLTKRPQNMVTMAPSAWAQTWPANVWAGCTAESQEWADKRLPHLVRVPAQTRFVSYEPAIGPVDFGAHMIGLDWIIYGGESGGGSRPSDLSWARSVVAQTRGTHVAAFIKQMGAKAFDAGERVHLNHPKGGEPSEWEEGLRVREFPVSKAGPLVAPVNAGKSPPARSLPLL
jgi:protein gp37